MNFSNEPSVYILYENLEWLAPLGQALNELGTPFTAWDMAGGQMDLSATPPEGIFYSKMSASAHTRGHLHAPDMAASVLKWLDAHGRRVINGYDVLQLEMKKTEQYISLTQAGLNVPRTIAANDPNSITKAAEDIGFPVILKPNRGGKGIGVKLMWTYEDLNDFLEVTNLAEFTVDGIVLLQEYIQTKDQSVTRMEFINGKFYYAVNVDTQGGFELCPADGCSIEGIACAVEDLDASRPRFTIVEDFNIPELDQCERFLRKNNIEIAGIEFMENLEGKRLFYDVNTNTNYNTIAEQNAGKAYSGIEAVARFLQRELEKVLHEAVR